MPTGRRWLGALASALCLGILAGCIGGPPAPGPAGGQNPGPREEPREQDPQPAEPEPGGQGSPRSAEPGHWFTVTDLRVGDTVGGMRVVRMEGVHLDEDRNNPDGIIGFSGEVTLSGTYVHHPPEDEFLGGMVCFDQLDEASLARLPRARGDDRYLWFCFRNVQWAREALAPAGVGEATVVIDEYTIDLSDTETWNTARLVRVEAVRNPQPWTKPVKVYPEGTEETRTFRLIYLPILPFTTYVPADWQHESMQNEEEGTVGIRLTAPNEIGFVEVVFFPPGTDRERVERAVAERLAAYPWRQPTDSDGTEFRAADRTASNPGQWKAAELQLGQRGDRYYYVLTHLNRLEAGDGWGPVVEAILDEWRWRDTGEPLRPTP